MLGNDRDCLPGLQVLENHEKEIVHRFRKRDLASIRSNELRPAALNQAMQFLDPRDTQAQLRHADPSVPLRHYQKSIPASVRAAVVALESELIGESGQSIRTGFEQIRN
jgi:hypothetical protein